LLPKGKEKRDFSNSQKSCKTSPNFANDFMLKKEKFSSLIHVP
jgi:hypothetical protein